MVRLLLRDHSDLGILCLLILISCDKGVKEMPCSGMKSPLKLFVKKSNFQIMIFAVIFVTMYGQTYKLFKNIFSDFSNIGQREDKYSLT